MDPLGAFGSSLHPHMLALDRDRYDGVFGLTAQRRWKRWFLNGQFQYYLRTKGEAGFKYDTSCSVSAVRERMFFLATLDVELQ